MPFINASIITIGDELLIGQTIDTNSAWIARELNKIGIRLKRRVAVGDVWDEIWKTLDEEREESEIIIITGGLGPTSDDITKPLLCKYFGGKLAVNEKVLEHIKYLFEKVYRRPGPLLERNRKQAEVPDNCIVLHNSRGTAPGMWFSPPAPQGGTLAPLNPPQGGALHSDSLKGHFSYTTADPFTYSLLKEFVKEHRSVPTEAEKILWEILRGKKMTGFKFRRQHIISNYIADFVYLSENLIIEVDGLHHQLPENKDSDEVRTFALNKLGFKVIRFTNQQIINETDTVVNIILQQLNQKKSEQAITQIPPLGGGGASPLVGEGAVISLPGVPYEMKGIMTDEVLPRLQQCFQLPAILHRTAFTAGQGESYLAELLTDFEASLPPHIKLAYLPAFGMVRLRLTATGSDKKNTEEELGAYFLRLTERVKDFLVSDTDEELEVVIGRMLKENNKTLGTAESCTGGYIAHRVTSVAGSSAWYKGSIISYANEAKENILGVTHETLTNAGAVSEETVLQMAKGALKKLQTDYVIATSGIMGPDGGTPDKPVGTVWMAVGKKDKIIAGKFLFRFSRERNIIQASLAALNMLRKFILENS